MRISPLCERHWKHGGGPRPFDAKSGNKANGTTKESILQGAFLNDFSMSRTREPNEKQGTEGPTTEIPGMARTRAPGLDEDHCLGIIKTQTIKLTRRRGARGEEIAQSFSNT